MVDHRILRSSVPRTVAVLAAVFLVLLAFSGAASAKGKKRKPKVKFDTAWASYPSARYAALEAAECTAELARRGVSFTKVTREPTPGVLAPVRLPKDVGGVLYRSHAAPNIRAQSPYDIFDCRLVLALSDFSKILVAHDIDEVVMFSAWRPPPRGWPKGKLGTRHPGALAIDVARLGKKLGEGQAAKDRVWLDIEADWAGKIGAPACGPGAAAPSAKNEPGERAAKDLRSIICGAADKHLFTSILTPNYNRAHENHVHLEVTPDVTWHLVR